MTFRTKLFLSYLALSLSILLAVDLTLDRIPGALAATSLAALSAAFLLSAWASRAAAQPMRAVSRSAARLEEQLRDHIGVLTEERDRLRATLAGMVEGVLVVASDGRVVIANGSAERILESDEPLSGRTVAEAIRHPLAREALERAIRDGVPVECRLEPLGIHARSVLLNVQPLEAKSGAVAVLHDVTAIRKLETIRRDFVSNVSHELQTPVSSILSHAETLLDGALADPEASRRFVDTIHRNAARMGRLVKDLLKLAQLETRPPDQAIREKVDVREIVDHVVATIQLRKDEPSAEISVAVAQDLFAFGDPDGISQMLLNLVENAIKYGRRDGKITVRAVRDQSLVALSVEDDGPGIESRHLARVFERFYRIDEGRSRERGGTGLGLAIVKHLAESMGGSVSVRSDVGRGSCFTVRLRGADP
jgi:two-component system, OmpR family, phosphate regulon sensor histidine kinase PhoR